MVGLCHWVTDVALKNWASLSGGTPAPAFVHMPPDVFVAICRWLSVRDILALRICNKSIARFTRESIIWNALFRRLMVPIPILPATSKHRFGYIRPWTYEKLMVRALYLEENWRRRRPLSSHGIFQAFDRTIAMKMLPGGKYLVTALRDSARYTLVLWDLDHAGRRVALTGATSDAPFLNLEAKFGVVDGEVSIVIAYTRPPHKAEDGRSTTTVVVCAIPVTILEELAEFDPTSELFRNCATTVEFPFMMIHASESSCEVGQLALGEFEGEMVLLAVHRPRALVFYYLNSGRRGNLLLGPVFPYQTLRHSIWSVKLLPGQNAVLVSRVLVEEGAPQDSTLFTLDMFLLPGPGSTYRGPTPVGRQFISGLHVDGFHFSDIETAWFASLRDPDGLLPCPTNNMPPPISIFITTRQPRGFVHCILRPLLVPNEVVKLPNNRGTLGKYMYELPAEKIARDTWTDDYARPVIFPGAYRSVVLMRPHVHPELLGGNDAPRGNETLRFCTYQTRTEGYDTFSTARSTGNVCTVPGQAGDGDEIVVEEQGKSVMEVYEEERGFRKRSLRVPGMDNNVAWDMMYGTTAVAFDESSGRMCVATTEDTFIHVLDFGGGGGDLAVVDT